MKTINIRSLNELKTVSLSPMDTLKVFKKKIKATFGINNNKEIKLIFAGKILNEELLNSLHNDTIVHLIASDKKSQIELGELAFVLPIEEFNYSDHFETCSRAQPTLFQHKKTGADCFIKKDLYDPHNAFFELIAYRIFNLLGITVPHASVIDENTDFYRIASFKFNNYKDLQNYFIIIVGSIKSNYQTSLRSNVIDEITDTNCLNQLPLVGFAEKNSCYYFCQDPYVLGWWYTNIGLIEKKDKLEVVKIDPSLYPRLRENHAMPILEYEEALSYFFGVKKYHPLFKATTPEQNIESFERIAAITDNQLYEAVYVPEFKKFESFISKRQNELFENLKHRRAIFSMIYEDFYLFYKKSKIESIPNLYDALVNITNKKGIPPIIACVLIGDLNLFKFCIEINVLDQAYFAELKYNNKNLLEYICSLGLHHFIYFCSEKSLFSDEQYSSYLNDPAKMTQLPLHPELFEFFLYKIQPSLEDLPFLTALIHSDSSHLIKIFDHKINNIINNYKSACEEPDSSSDLIAPLSGEHSKLLFSSRSDHFFFTPRNSDSSIARPRAPDLDSQSHGSVIR